MVHFNAGVLESRSMCNPIRVPNSPPLRKKINMRRNLAILLTGILLALGNADACKAGLVVTWADLGGELNLSIKGTWSEWESTTAMTEDNDLLFGDNSVDPFALEFDLRRNGLGTENSAGNPVGASALLNVVSGSGSVTAPDIVLPPTIFANTRYRLEYLNEGGSLALTAGVIPAEEFFIDESFNLGSNFTLTAGIRTFNNSNFPGGETLTMNYVPASNSTVPEPNSMAILALGFGLFAGTRRRRIA